MMNYFARAALLGMALVLPACGAAVAALIDEVTEAIEDDGTGNGNTVVIAGNGLVAIDLATGERTVVSDANVGTGTVLADPHALAFDAGGDRCQVWDAGRAAVIAVDVLTGDRALLASSTRGTGTPLASVRALAYDTVRDRLLAADVRATETVLVAVDMGTGNRTTITGAGPELELPRSMVVDGNTALVGDASLRAIVAVDLVTGAREILSASTHGQGPLFVTPNGLALMGGHVLVLDASLNTLYSVDLVNGDRVVVSSASVGFGSGFVSPSGVAFDTAAWEALVTQPTPAPVMLVRVDPLTGDRAVASSSLVGLGPVLAYPSGIAYDGARARVLVLNRTNP
jgi:hypothetical protein